MLEPIVLYLNWTLKTMTKSMKNLKCNWKQSLLTTDKLVKLLFPQLFILKEIRTRKKKRKRRKKKRNLGSSSHR